MLEQTYTKDMLTQWSNSEQKKLISNRFHTLDHLDKMLPNRTRLQIRTKIRLLGYSYRLLQSQQRSERKLGLSEVDKAYMAGIVDGEGTIRIAFDPRHGKSYSPGISVSNTNRPLLEWFKNKVGAGYISRYEYYCNNYDAKPLLEDLLPYLRIKHKHAELVIEFINLRLSRKKWDEQNTKREIEIFNKVSELNQKPKLTKRIPTEKEVKEYLEAHR